MDFFKWLKSDDDSEVKKLAKYIEVRLPFKRSQTTSPSPCQTILLSRTNPPRPWFRRCASP